MTWRARLIALRRPLTLGAAILAGSLTLWLGLGVTVEDAADAARHGFRRHPASGEIHIVEIDERSIAAIARWPWARSVHAAAVDRLHSAGARSIAFDVDFSSPSDPAEDARFAASLERAGHGVILTTFRQYAGSGSGEAMEAAPIPTLARSAFLAAANVDPDSDGRLRRMLFGLEILGAPRPSLASMVAERPGAAGRSFAIDTRIDPASIPRHSLIDVLRGRVPAAAIRGKRLIIGATAVELGDRYSVPHHGVIPGVVAQAMGAETLLEGEPPAQRSGGWALALALILVAATALPKGRRPLRAALAAAGSAALFLLPPFAEQALGALPVAPALAALAAAAMAGGAAWLALRYRENRLEDPETGLPNLLALERAAADRAATAVCVARIEDLPALISALGSDAAAALLRTLADRLRFAVGGTVWRADEASLAWLEPGDAPVKERIEGVAALMRAPLGGGAAADVRLHYGAAFGSGTDLKQTAANAGLAAGAAAAAGQRWQLFTAEDGEAVSQGVALLSEFGAAMTAGHVRNAYQPKLDLHSGVVTAVEALVRWDHPVRGPLSPDAFVPLIERHGRAADLTVHVLGRALADAAAWAAAGRPLAVAVNVSASLLNDEAAMARLRAMVSAAAVPPERLTIEVTETATMADPARAIAALEAWRALGVGVSIDDYGTGQSSLSYLQTLPATEIKIDRSFVATIAEAPRNAIMVRSTIAMAHELGFEVVAEGVEDEACLALLREMGCDLAQGYLIARPMRAEDVAAFPSAPRAASAAA